MLNVLHVALTKAQLTLPVCAQTLECVDRQVNSGLFEIVSAIKYNAQLWSQLPPDTLDLIDCPRYASGICPDYGIDCASADLSCIVQAKWYAKTSRIAFSHIANFALMRALITEQVPHTKSILTHTPTKIGMGCLAGARVSQIAFDEIAYTEMADIINTHAHAHTPVCNVGDSATYILREYQQDALNAVIAGAEFISMPCGTGKTVVIGALCRMCKTKTILIVVPSIMLMYQTRNVLLKLGFTHSQIGMVGDAHVVSKLNTDAKITICVLASIKHITWPVDRLIVDEAHHVDYRMNKHKILTETTNAIVAEKRVYMSATLKNADFAYTIGDAIASGYLCDYCVVVPIVELRENIKQSLVNMIYERNEWTHILAYCNSIDACVQFNEMLNARGIVAERLMGTHRCLYENTLLSVLGVA